MWRRWITYSTLSFPLNVAVNYVQKTLSCHVRTLKRNDSSRQIGKETRIWSTTKLGVSFVCLAPLVSHGIDSKVAQNPVGHTSVDRKILKRSPHFLTWRAEEWASTFRWVREVTVLFLLFYFSLVQLIVILQRDSSSRGRSVISDCKDRGILLSDERNHGPKGIG